MSRADRREYQRPESPFPVREKLLVPPRRPRPKKPWVLERRFVGERKEWMGQRMDQFYSRKWRKDKAYVREQDAENACAAHTKGFWGTRGFEYRVVYHG